MDKNIPPRDRIVSRTPEGLRERYPLEKDGGSNVDLSSYAKKSDLESYINQDDLPLSIESGGFGGRTQQEALTNLNACDKAAEAYSLDEIKTNNTWIDGKPIYKKTFSLFAAANSTISIDLAAISSNIERIWADMSASFCYNETYAWPFVYNTSTADYVRYYITGGKIWITNVTSSSRTIVSTWLYTKTTD